MRILAYSPLRLSWAGPEAVVVFFVLSGYVLALPFATNLNRSWASYYGKRLVRLYLPVWGALAFTVAVILTVRPHALGGGNPVVDGFSVRHDGPALGRDAVLLFAHTRRMERSPVVAQMGGDLLPSTGALRDLRATRPPPAVGRSGRTARHDDQPDSDGHRLRYLPMFGVGTLLAMTEPKWRAVLRRVASGSRTYRVTFTLFRVALLDLDWLLIGTTLSRLIASTATRNGIVTENVAVTLGAVLLIIIALTFRGTGRLLESRPLGWLGSRSYSLYLVHFPIVISTAFLFKGWSWTGLATMLTATAIDTELFYRVVERPSIRLAGLAGAATQRAVEADNSSGTTK